jgi:hypothetical protein
VVAKSFVQSFLFCDEVRTEQTGKDIAIGIYNGEISVPQTPFILPSFAVRIELYTDGKPISQLSFRMIDPHGSVLVEQDAPVNFIDWHKPGAITLNMPNAIFPSPGRYVVQLGIDGGWVFERFLDIEKVDVRKIAERYEDQAKRMKAILDAEVAKRTGSHAATSPQPSIQPSIEN